jgi:hypothetical protein
MTMKSKIHTPKTVAELRAILDARMSYAKAIAEAARRGDLEACDKAQQAMREAFPNG